MATDLIGVSRSIDSIRVRIEQAVAAGLHTAILGERGVGKEVVAQQLYSESPRAGKPFVKLNCAALKPGNVDRELFGVAGGEGEVRQGSLNLAEDGVLFLDELPGLSLLESENVRRVLTDGRFSRVGGETVLQCRAWILAAVVLENDGDGRAEALSREIEERLGMAVIHIPPLRRRPEDIRHIINYYARQKAGNSSGVPMPGGELMDRLKAYSWPGNVRELVDVLQKYMISGDWDRVMDSLKPDG